ncbi:MAG: hypothetical protein ABII09_01700 [Planctomycetota bacterium]
MKLRQLLYVMVLLMLAGCQQQEAVKTDESQQPMTRAEADTQLKVNQEALLHGATDGIRLDAAMVMLFSDSPRDRGVLMDTLKQSDNKPAQVAVCKALVAARETRRNVKDEKDFLVPLSEILRNDEGTVAKAAAEAALIFDYGEISNVLEPMASDSTLPVRARLNAIYALKLQFDVRAITQLVELVEDKELQVASAAREALRSVGIPVDGNAESRAKILSELRTRGMERFQRDWIVQQESRVSALQKERDTWRNQYLGALDRIYEGLADEGQRGKLLTEQLVSPEAAVRLWALEKVSQWRVGTQPKLPTEIGPVLVKLISDSNRDVRLATAKLLSLTGELSSAERLAEQFKVEQDEQVKLEMFIALGSACHYALVPSSGIQLSPEIRRQTMEWAVQYLNDEDGKKAYNGAEVLRKLLEPGGLAADDAARYLDMLVERYNRELKNSDGALRGELLGAMARLCGQSSYRPETSKRFATLFENALNDENELVRETAVDGLICIDKTRALKLLAKDFVNDRSQIIRNRVMELAAEVGSKDDLPWLWEKIGTNGESKAAWQAMLKIFNGCDIETVEKWLGRFDSQEERGKLANEQWTAFLELAERKAVSENRTSTARAVREKLARQYITSGQFEQAAECLGKLRESAQTAKQKDAVLGQLMEVYLRWPKVESAAWLVSNCLLGGDLGADSEVVHSIEAFWDKPAGGADPNAVLESLRKIKPAGQRPKWEQQMTQWMIRFGQAKKVEEPNVNGGRSG